MRPLSPVLASLANVFRIPLSQTPVRPGLKASTEAIITSSTITPAIQPTAPRTFSTTTALCKRKPTMSAGAAQAGKKITLIRYFLWHPQTPRPLRFSRTRALRHWTIHRAWQLHQANERRQVQLDLQRQEQAMNRACEELRTGAGDGGRLFRKAMNKKGVFEDLFPIEYGRLQTDGPSRDGWNHEWKRVERK